MVNFLELPVDILGKITEYLTPIDISRLKQTSKQSKTNIEKIKNIETEKVLFYLSEIKPVSIRTFSSPVVYALTPALKFRSKNGINFNCIIQDYYKYYDKGQLFLPEYYLLKQNHSILLDDLKDFINKKIRKLKINYVYHNDDSFILILTYSENYNEIYSKFENMEFTMKTEQWKIALNELERFLSSNTYNVDIPNQNILNYMFLSLQRGFKRNEEGIGLNMNGEEINGFKIRLNMNG
jgi:hypothetical protein